MVAATTTEQPSVTATPAAVEMIERLREKHGPIVFHQSGGCCEGSCMMCLGADELPPGPNDVRLGEIAGVPFLIDADQHNAWGEPDFEIDVAPGASDSFSLEGPEGVHFVTRSDRGRTCQPSPSSSPISSA
jgi:uncharacterized protein (DUF779 family)